MGAWLRFLYTRAAWLGPLIFLSAVAMAWVGRDLRLETSIDNLMPVEGEAQRILREAQRDFPEERAIVVYVEATALFSPEALEALASLHESLAALDGLERVESLFTAPHVAGGLGWVETAPLLDNLPLGEEEAVERLQAGLANPMLAGRLLSPQAQSVLYRLIPLPSLEEAEERELLTSVQAVVASAPAPLEEVAVLGSGAMQGHLEALVQRDQWYLLPISGLLLYFLLALILRSLREALLPLANTALAIAWMLGLMSILGIPFNLLSSAVPLLVLVVGAAQDTHLLAAYREARGVNLKGALAWEQAAREMALPLGLAAITTILGFGATGFSPLPLVSDFGKLAALGIACRYAALILASPIGLRVLEASRQWIPPRKERPAEETPAKRCATKTASLKSTPVKSTSVTGAPLKKTTKMEKVAQVCRAKSISQRVARILVDRVGASPWPAVGVIVLVGGLLFFGLQRLEVNNAMLSFLPERDSLRQKVERLGETMGSTKSLQLIITRNAGDFRRSNPLLQLEGLSEAIRGLPGVSQTSSLADAVALVNREMRAGEASEFRVPGSDALVAQFLFFFHPDDLSPFVTSDFSRACLYVQTSLEESGEILALAAEIEALLTSGRFGAFDYHLTGEALAVAEASRSVAFGQVISLSFLVVALLLIISGLFLSPQVAFLAVLGNLFPVAILFSFLGVSGIPLNVGTSLVAAIGLGLAVDDTLHLMIRYNREVRRRLDEREALREAVSAELLPVTATTVALAAGFVVLGGSSFVPVQQFGLLGAGVLLLAFVGDLVLTPALLATKRVVTLWDVLGLRLRRQLRDVSQLFRGLSSWQTRKLILLAQVRELQPGEVLIRQDDQGNQMYVVIDGELHVSREVRGEKRALAKLGLGDVVGEVALVSAVRRTATVTALEPSRVLVLDWPAVERVGRFSPYLAARLYLNLAAILGQRIVKRNELE